MIDVQAELYTIGRNAVIAEYPDAEVSAATLLQPSKFPCVSIVEASNKVFRQTSDSARIENHAEIMIEVNVFATGDRKQQDCRAIMNVIDTKYGNIGLERIMMYPIDNFNDTTVYRMVARYRGVISVNKEIYRR